MPDSMTADRDLTARALLAFYQEAGVDALVGERPVDRLAGEPPPAAAPMEPAPANPDTGFGEAARPAPARVPELRERPSAPVLSPDAAVMAAREAARSAVSLAELKAILDRFEGCALRTTATQLVFADGDPRARVMFVGEAPGRDEDIEGLPFVGRFCKLL